MSRILFAPGAPCTTTDSQRSQNLMRFPDQNITSVGDLVGQLRANLAAAQLTVPIWYRGQSNTAWHLDPKLLREQNPSETHLLNRFKQSATLLLTKHPESEFEWMFLMQHHGISTRLLDWSESPLVALYFAIASERNVQIDGALWILLPTILNEKSNYKPDYPNEIPSFEDIHLTNYSPTTISQEHKSKLLPMAAIAPRNSPRMQAQQGVFTITHRENIVIEDVGAAGAPRDHVWR